jgi:signal transduction histidine kinase
MISAADHPDELNRLKELLEYEVLDTEDEICFDELTELASTLCNTPISLISLVDDKRQWFKSRVGLDATETPKEIAFCSHAILQDHIFEVPNALEDARFSDNPLVTEAPNIRFYAGAPLITSEGYPLGTLCVIDTHCNTLSEKQKKALTILAKQVVSQLTLRLQNKRLERMSKEREKIYAILAHDLKSPFNGVIGLSKLLVNSAENFDHAQIKQFSTEIQKASLNIFQILDEILQWSEECMGNSSCRLTSASLRTAIDESAEVLNDALVLKHLTLDISSPSEQKVLADNTLLKIVLRNLLANAIKYSPESASIKITSSASEGVVQCTISDQGSGISNELKAQLFKSSVTSQTGTFGELGHGLGLSLCGDLIDKQNGKIWLDESYLSGTRIIFELPAA